MVNGFHSFRFSSTLVQSTRDTKSFFFPLFPFLPLAFFAALKNPLAHLNEWIPNEFLLFSWKQKSFLCTFQWRSTAIVSTSTSLSLARSFLSQISDEKKCSRSINRTVYFRTETIAFWVYDDEVNERTNWNQFIKNHPSKGAIKISFYKNGFCFERTLPLSNRNNCFFFRVFRGANICARAKNWI